MLCEIFKGPIAIGNQIRVDLALQIRVDSDPLAVEFIRYQSHP